MAVKASVAFIGLGVMGYPMAGHLQNAGYVVTVYNRTTSKAERWVSEYGGEFAHTPKKAVSNAQWVFCCVGNDDDVREVLLGDNGAICNLAEGAVIIDHTTTSAHLSRELAQRFRELGHWFIDAPVSGGQAGAENGLLTVMCGGDPAVFESAKQVVDCYAQSVKLLGSSGAGQLTKMVNQICIAGLVQGLAEGIHFARSAELDIAAVVDVISKGAAQSWQMDNRYQTMIEGEYQHGFAVDWMRKDLGYVLEEAGRNGSELPVTKIVDKYYSDVQSMGGNRWDTSSLLARLETNRKK